MLDAAAWGLVAIAGLVVIALADRAERGVDRWHAVAPDPARRRRWFGFALLVGAVLHVVHVDAWAGRGPIGSAPRCWWSAASPGW